MRVLFRLGETYTESKFKIVTSILIMGLFPFLMGQNSDNRNGDYKCLWALFLTDNFKLIDGRTLFLNFHKQQYFSANKVFQLGLISLTPQDLY